MGLGFRFYRKWMVCREWSIKMFWDEFNEEEYKIDPLKYGAFCLSFFVSLPSGSPIFFN